jgi:hypothetical protein
MALPFLVLVLYQFTKVWLHFCELKVKPSIVFKRINGYAIYSFGIIGFCAQAETKIFFERLASRAFQKISQKISCGSLDQQLL